MVKKHFCDKCGKEINNVSSNDFDEMFNSVSSRFGGETPVLQPQLCEKCEKGYNKIIDETNNKIKDYLNGDDDKKELKKKKFGLF